MKRLKLFFSLLVMLSFAIGNVWGADPVTIYLNEGATGTANGVTASGNVNTTASNGNPAPAFGCTSASNKTITITGLTTSGYTDLTISFDVKWSFCSTTNTWPYVKVTTYKNNAVVMTNNTTAAPTSKLTGYQHYDITGVEEFDKLVLEVSPAIGKSGSGNAATTYNDYIDNIKITGVSSSGSTETTVNVEGVSLDQASLTLVEGATETLVATVSPDNATNKNVTWTSGNESVATVSADGVVTAKAAGTAVITVKSAADATKTATCDVTVNAFTPAAGTYYIVPNNALWGTSYTGTFSNSANALTLTGSKCGISFALKNGSSTNGYIKDDQTRCYNGYTLKLSAPAGFELTNIVITEGDKASDPTASVGSYDTESNTWTGNAPDVTFTYSNTSAITNLAVTYAAGKTLTGISITGTATDLWKGETFSHDGIAVMASWSEGDPTDVTADCAFSGYDANTIGEQTITVNYKGQQTSYTVKVKTIANTQETAYTTAEAIALIDAGKDLLTEVYVKGKVSKVDSYNSDHNSITYWLDDNAFEVYGGLAGEIKAGGFTSVDDIAVGADVIVKGVITDYKKNGVHVAYEFNANNVLVAYDAPSTEKQNATISATYKKNMAADDADDEYTVSYDGDGVLSITSSDETVAEAIIEGKDVIVDVKKAGTTTITISATETEAYAAASMQYTLTVSPAFTAASLPFTFDGGRADVNPANGIQQTGLGTDYSASPKLKFDGANDEVIVRINATAVLVSYDIKGNGSGQTPWAGQFDVLESANGLDYTTLATHTELSKDGQTETQTPLATSRYFKFVYAAKTTGNVALGNINITNVMPKATPEFSIANMEIVVDEVVAPTVNKGGSTGAITYNVPENDYIFESDGEINAVYVGGPVTVTATMAEDENYKSATTTFTVTVVAAPIPAVPVSIVFPYDGKYYALKSDLSVVEVLYADDKLINIVEADKAALTWNKKEADGKATFCNDEGKYLGTGASNSIALSETAVEWDVKENYYSMMVGQTERTFLLKDGETVKNYAVSNAGNSGYSTKAVFATGFAMATLENISLGGTYTTEFSAGSEFEHEGLVVTANYEGGITKIVTAEAAISTPDMSEAGEKTVTVSYNGKEASYTITVAAPVPTISVDKDALAFGAVNINTTVDAKTVAVTLENLAAATVAISGEGAAKFAVDVTNLTESGDVTVSATADEAGEFTATLTIAGEGAESKTVALSMNVIVPDNCDGTDDFETATNTTPATYMARTTTDGWSATNVALITIGDEKFLAINGKTTAVGVITSPAISGGLKALKIRYANTFSESNGAKFRVDVKANDKVVYTETVTRANADMTQNEIYTVEFTDMKVFYDDFQIVITNLSPSNSTSNKDRLSIGRICYTTYGEVAEPRELNGVMGTHCYPFTIKAGEYSGASFFTPAYRIGTSKLYWDEVTGDIEAGKPYLIVPDEDATEFVAIKQANSVEAPIAAHNMVGSFNDASNYLMVPANGHNYIVYNNEFRLAGANVAVGQYRAYIHLISDEDGVGVTEQVLAPAPGRRRISMNNAEAQVATGLESIVLTEEAQKLMINGQLHIIRGGKMFNAAGLLVK